MLKTMSGFVFWIALIIIMLTYMTLWFGLAVYTKRYDVVDSAWGLGFVLVAWVSLAIRQNWQPIALISAGLVSLWGLRLFGHIANRNFRKSEDDHRYQLMREKWGSAEHRKAYTNVFLLQGALIMIVSVPMIAIAQSTNLHLNAGVIVGWIVWLKGISFEALADLQLARFIKARSSGSHQIMNKGLWRYSRHPNYFGEVVTWWGATIVGISIGSWWGILGALAITLLITKISGIPPLEKHYDGNKDYEAYRKKTSVFFPLPPRKAV